MLQNFFQSSLLIKGGIILLGFIIIQFFFIRPRKKEEEKRNTFLKKLTLGTEVITIGGIYGKIVKIKEKTVILEIDVKGTLLTIKKQALLHQASEATENNNK